MNNYLWPPYWTKEELQLANELAILAQEYGADRLFVATMAERVIRPVESANASDYGPITTISEILAYCLCRFSNNAPTQDVITPTQTRMAWESAEKLLFAREARDLGKSLNERSDNNDSQSSAGAVQTVNRFMRTVRSPAYPEQTSRQINEIQGRFDSWFNSNCGIAPTQAVALLWAITARTEKLAEEIVTRAIQEAQRINQDSTIPRQEIGSRASWMYACSFINQALEVLPMAFSEAASLLEPPLQRGEWDSFISLLSLTPESYQEVAHLEDMRRYPIFRLKNDSIYFVDLGHTFQILWEVFDAKAKTNQQFYQRYQKQRQTWLEEQTAICLSRVFGTENVGRSLLYPNPDQPNNETEMDGLALCGSSAVLVECKAKQFRIVEQLQRRKDGTVGDAGRLASDIVANVVEAYQQGQRAFRFVEANESPVFKERETGKEFPIKKLPSSKFPVLTVSLVEQGGIANYRAAIQELGLLPQGISSLALTIWELDIITQFCDGPDVFIHYLERRVLLQRAAFDTFADEIDCFGIYLDTRLHSDTFEVDNRTPNLIMFDGFGSLFDQWMNYQRGLTDKEPVIELQIPEEVKMLQADLRKVNEEWARQILFAILDAKGEVLAWMEKAVQYFKANIEPGGMKSSCFESENTVWCIVASRRGSRDELKQTLEARLTTEQYGSRLRYGVGFGLYLPDPDQPFATAMIRDAPWKQNLVLAALIAATPRNQFFPSSPDG